jgi:hypothetical protein
MHELKLVAAGTLNPTQGQLLTFTDACRRRAARWGRRHLDICCQLKAFRAADRQSLPCSRRASAIIRSGMSLLHQKSWRQIYPDLLAS